MKGKVAGEHSWPRTALASVVVLMVLLLVALVAAGCGTGGEDTTTTIATVSPTTVTTATPTPTTTQAVPTTATTALPQPETTTTEAAAPAGPLAIVQGENELALLRVGADGKEPRLLTDKVGMINEVAWSQDGMKLALSSATYPVNDVFVAHERIWTMNADGLGTREVQLRWPSQPYMSKRDIWHLSWSPDASRVAFVVSYVNDDETDEDGVSQAVAVLDLSSGDVTLLGESPQGGWGPVSWSADGSKILVFFWSAEGVESLVSFDATTGAKSVEDFAIDWTGPGDGSQEVTMAGLAYSPDRTRLLSVWKAEVSLEGAPAGQSFEDPLPPGTTFLVLSDPDGSRPALLSTITGSVNSPTWSPDGQIIAYSYRVWDWSTIDWGDPHVASVSLASPAKPIEICDGSSVAWRPSSAK